MMQLDDGRIWKRHIDQLRSGPIERVSETEPYSINVESYDRYRYENPIASPTRQLPTEQTRDPKLSHRLQQDPYKFFLPVHSSWSLSSVVCNLRKQHL